MPEGRTGWALVTGAAGGVGGVVCRRLAGLEGIEVVGVDIAPISEGLATDTRQCNLDDGVLRERLLTTLLEERGAPLLWASCAGRYERLGLEDYERGLYEETFGANFGHVFWVARRIAPAMAAAEGGRIVLVSSQAGASGGKDPVYAAAKAAVTALGKSLAREYARAGVICNVVSPGPTDTPMAAAMGARRRHYERTMPIGRLATADEVAEVVCMLLEARGQAMTGATVDVDGGLLRR